MMIASGTFTLKNLRLAFDEYVSVHGEDKARATLKEATGAETPAEVNEKKIVVGVAALVSSLTVPSEPGMQARSRRGRFTLAAIHSRLDEIGEKAFARMRSLQFNNR
jgi:hypothetical protein